MREERAKVRTRFQHGDFIEIYCGAALEICEQRDPKGMYRKARSGEIAEFSGVSAPYEPPVNPELEIDTRRLSLEESVAMVMWLLKERSVV